VGEIRLAGPCEKFHKVLASIPASRFSARPLRRGVPVFPSRFTQILPPDATIFGLMTAHYQRRSSSAAKAAGFLALIAALFAFFAMPAFAADEVHAAPTMEKADGHGDGGAKKKQGLPNFAPVLWPGIGGTQAEVDAHGHVTKPAVLGPLNVNNSMVITWIVAIGIIVFAQVATKRIRTVKGAAREVPSGAQNFWELMVEGLYNFLGEILGPKLVKMTFWFFATIFIFILFTNWFGLLPGVGTVGWSVPEDPNFPHSFKHVSQPLLRGGNADLNMTAAMALTFFAFWMFAPKGKEKGFMGVFLIVVFLAVGLIEVVSILFRPVSLSFRLYGNVFAGENILEAMQTVVPGLAPFLPIPFYFLELLVGLVQALVFTLLTSVFTLLICEHEDEGHGEEAKAHH
jgi:F-type H+-transporting ATPase subunit a